MATNLQKFAWFWKKEEARNNSQRIQIKIKPLDHAYQRTLQ